MTTPESFAVAIDRARAQCATLGHELGTFHAYGPSLVVAHCTRCVRPVWAGRREVFGLPTEDRCDAGER